MLNKKQAEQLNEIILMLINAPSEHLEEVKSSLLSLSTSSSLAASLFFLVLEKENEALDEKMIEDLKKAQAEMSKLIDAQYGHETERNIEETKAFKETFNTLLEHQPVNLLNALLQLAQALFGRDASITFEKTDNNGLKTTITQGKQKAELLYSEAPDNFFSKGPMPTPRAYKTTDQETLMDELKQNGRLALQLETGELLHLIAETTAHPTNTQFLKNVIQFAYLAARQAQAGQFSRDSYNRETTPHWAAAQQAHRAQTPSLALN